MSRPHQRGLTLIEIALAVSILAFMGIATAGTIGRSFDAYEAVTGIDGKYHNVRMAMNRMARDISMAFITPAQSVRDEDRQWKTIFKGGDESPFDELTFTSFSHRILLQDAKESDQCEITYFGKADEDDSSKINLMRREDWRLDEEPEKGGRVYVLAEDIKDFKLRYFDAKDDDWTDEWDTEKSEFQGRLPSIVELTITIEDDSGEEVKFVTKTRVFIPNLIRL
ncbi:MAG: type II secretion system protein GspJ [Myxococcota bacterium]|nr:type II secretion system protein GspJ [Myxococcota bacterium]